MTHVRTIGLAILIIAVAPREAEAQRYFMRQPLATRPAAGAGQAPVPRSCGAPVQYNWTSGSSINGRPLTDVTLGVASTSAEAGALCTAYFAGNPTVVGICVWGTNPGTRFYARFVGNMATKPLQNATSWASSCQ